MSDAAPSSASSGQMPAQPDPIPSEPATSDPATTVAPEHERSGRSGRAPRGMFAALAYRDYRLLWTGNILTQTGQWMQQVALGWLVLELTDSPTYLGLVGFARGIPMLLVALPAGVLVDRVDRRRLLMTAQVTSATLAAILAVLVVTDLIRPWHVLLLSLLAGSAQAVIVPSRQALVPGLVPRENLANAVALYSSGQNSTRVFGPSLAGVLIGAIGTASCFFAQAFSLLLAALMSFRLRIPPRTVARSSLGAMANLAEGLRYIRSSPRLSGLIGLAIVPAILAQPYLQMLPVIARDELGTGSGGLGLLMTASGAGALLGSLVYAAVGASPRVGNLQILTAAVFGGMLAVFALSSSLALLPLSLVLVFLTSGINSVYMAQNNTTIQMNVSDEFRGRVVSVYLMTWGLMPFGTLPLGALADAIGAPLAVAAFGLLSTLLVLLIGLRIPALRRHASPETI